jgi:N-methylhydantoinase A
VLNSFVSAGAETYIGKLTDRFRELGLGDGRLSFMQSLGGHISADDAMTEPIRLSHSGPVGGVVAATHFASLLGEDNIITADLGGTSFDTALIRDSRPTHAHRMTINRLLTGLSSVDIHAIGAGGGSILWVDERGLPRVGPHSAGAHPGPACYGNGGERAALTDASLILGLIDPDKFWGGTVTLDVDAARAALAPLADQLGASIEDAAASSIEDAAAGFHQIAVTHMGTAIAKVSLGRGYDPRDFTVLGYGGGSGLFLAEVCAEMGIKRLVMPRAAATFSAYGLLFADAVHAAATTAEWSFGEGPIDEINALYARLEEQAVSSLRREGFTEANTTVRREADVKFVGQSFEISMDMPSEPLADADREGLTQRFMTEYERQYGAGAAWEGFPIVLHTARVVASGITEKPPIGGADGDDGDGAPASPTGERQITLRTGTFSATTYDGASLRPGATIDGPALIDDVDTTLLVPAGDRLEVDPMGNYVFTVDTTAPAALQTTADGGVR